MRRDSTNKSWQLHLDGARCDGHGICLLRFSERISLDEWGFASVDGTSFQSARMMRRAQRAVRACPEDALTLVELPAVGVRTR